MERVRWWTVAAQRYGIEALMPKDRRPPRLGCGEYADRLDDRGCQVAKSAVQEILVRHGLGRRAQRIARAAAICVQTTGLITDTATEDEPFGFCRWAERLGDLVALDSVYIGNLKGVGKVHQLIPIDTATRRAFVTLVLGTPTSAVTARSLTQKIRHYRRYSVRVRAVLTDNGPEYIATFTATVTATSLRHERIPPLVPNHNAVCECF
jgi:hypothetical protein